jgi:hypothetical protein
MYHYVVSLKQTDVTEVRTAVIIALIREAVRTSKSPVCLNEITWRFYQKAVNLFAMRT